MPFNFTTIIKDKKDKILSIGKNLYIKIDPIILKISKELGWFYTKKVYIHTKIDAIIKCNNIIEAYIIKIYKLNKKQE